MVLDSLVLQWLSFALIFWLAVLTAFLVQTVLHYRRLTKNITKKDLKNSLTQILNKLDLNQKQLQDIDGQLGKVKLNLKTHLQKVGFVRFNPFSATGGDQSFALALLDDKDSGIVLSSLHSRDTTRLYAKTIKNGQAETGYELSKEELKAIQSAK